MTPRIVSATSSGCADFFNGVLACTYDRISCQSSVHGVSTKPGATAFTQISGPSTLASKRVRWLSAAFDAAYGIELPVGRTPASDVTLTTLAAPAALRCGTAATVTVHV